MLELEPSREDLDHLPLKRDLVLLSREEALGLFERKLAEGRLAHGPAREGAFEGARIAQWRYRAADGTPVRVQIALQDFHVTVSVVRDAG